MKPSSAGFYWLYDPEEEDLEVVEYDDQLPGHIFLIDIEDAQPLSDFIGCLFEYIPFPESP